MPNAYTKPRPDRWRIEALEDECKELRDRTRNLQHVAAALKIKTDILRRQLEENGILPEA